MSKCSKCFSKNSVSFSSNSGDSMTFSNAVRMVSKEDVELVLEMVNSEVGDCSFLEKENGIFLYLLGLEDYFIYLFIFSKKEGIK